MNAPMRARLVAMLSTMALFIGLVFVADALDAISIDTWPWWLRWLLWIAAGGLASEVGAHFEERAERRASADRETPP